MAYAPRAQRFTPADRLFKPLLELHIITSAFFVSLDAMLRGKDAWDTWKPDSTVGLLTVQEPHMAFKMNYTVPMFGVAHALKIAFIDIKFERVEPLTDPVHLPHVLDHILQPFTNVVTLTYVSFYEQWRPVIEQRYTADIHHWPPLFAFARRVRDFIVHSDGVVSFKSANAASVSWHALTYSPTDNGKQMIGADLGFGDLLVLVLELDDEMTALGFPNA